MQEGPAYRLKLISGRSNWHICWWDNSAGREQRTSTGHEDESDALRFFAEWLTANNAAPSEPTQTTRELLDAYLTDRKNAVLDYTRLDNAAKRVIEHFGAIPPASITKLDVATYHKHRAGKSPATIRKELGTLVAALNFGRREGWFDRAPVISLGDKPPPRNRWLKPEEAARLEQAADQTHIYTYIVLGLQHGARKAAILGLTWGRVDFDLGLVSYVDPERAETDKRRSIVPMNNKVRRVLLQARELAESEYVIEWNGRQVKNIKRAFARVCARARLVDVMPHTLRHTCATHLAMHGASLDQIADMLAADTQTIKRNYRKFQPDFLRGTVELLDDERPIHLHRSGDRKG